MFEQICEMSNMNIVSVQIKTLKKKGFEGLRRFNNISVMLRLRSRIYRISEVVVVRCRLKETVPGSKVNQTLHQPLPSGVSAKGFISTWVASTFINNSYSLRIWSAACAQKPIRFY